MEPEGRGWWSPRAEVRSGNEAGRPHRRGGRLAAIEQAIRARRSPSTSPAGMPAGLPSSAASLTRPPCVTCSRRPPSGSPVRLLLWAGPPLPAFHPTRRMVKRAREEFVRDSSVQCALDQREAPMHCHHEKIVIVDGDARLRRRHRLHRARRRPARRAPTTRRAARSAGTTPPSACAGRRSPTSPDTSSTAGTRYDRTTSRRPRRPSRPATSTCRCSGRCRRRSTTFLPARRVHDPRTPTCARCARPSGSSTWRTSSCGRRRSSTSSPTSSRTRRATSSGCCWCCRQGRPTERDTTRGQLGSAARGRRRGAAGCWPPRSARTTRATRRRVYVHAKVGIVDDRWLTDRLGQPQRALPVQRHRDERAHLRRGPGPRHAAAPVVRAHRTQPWTRSWPATRTR